MKSSALNIKLSLFGGLETNPGSYVYSVSVLPPNSPPNLERRMEDGKGTRREKRRERDRREDDRFSQSGLKSRV